MKPFARLRYCHFPFSFMPPVIVLTTTDDPREGVKRIAVIAVSPSSNRSGGSPE